jgi:hypothetical protein
VKIGRRCLSVLLWVSIISYAAQVHAQAPAEAPSAPAAPSFTPQQLDELVAPIALYPDPLLAQVFAASTYPLEIVQADRWLKANPNLWYTANPSFRFN